MKLSDNLVLARSQSDRKAFLGLLGIIRHSAVKSAARRISEAMDVRKSGDDPAAGSLSGGNLQKFIVGREIRQDPRVMVAAQPTWGVDVGASAQIRQALVDLRDRGCAVLVVSEELDELLEICDRIAVIANGRLSPAMPAAELDAERIGLLMAGSQDDGHRTDGAGAAELPP